MSQPAELRGEQWTRPTYGGRPVTVTPAARAAGPVGDVQPLLDLALIMAESDDVEAILELAVAAVPTLASGRCLGAFGSSDPLPDGDGTIAYPLRTTSFHHGFLVVAADRALLPEEDGRLRLLAQQTAVALSGTRRTAKHRKDAYELARANVALSRLVDELRRTVEIHARLDEVATSGAGLDALAATLHAMTGFPVVIEDRYGNLLASAPDGPAGPGVAAGGSGSPDGDEWEAVVKSLLCRRKPTRVGPRLVVLAAPRYDVVGLLSLLDPAGAAGKFELLALEHGATVLAVELARLASVVEAEYRVGRDLLEDLVSGRGGRTALQRARAFGIDLTRPYRIALVHPTTVPDRERDADAVLPVVRRLARELGIDLIASARPEGVLLLAAGDPAWDRFHQGLDHDTGDTRWRIAVGGPCQRPADALRSYRESLLIRPLQRTPSAAAVLAWETLGVYRILSSLDDVDGLERLVAEQLGPLLDHDAERGSQLVETLHHYLESGGSPTSTAKALFVHASTVKYRLNRIRDVGGYDLSAPSTRFALQLASQAWLVLQALRETAPPDASP